MTLHRPRRPGPALLPLLLLLPGCDPMLNLWGSLLPAWVLCLALGVALTVALRFAFAVKGLEPHLGPLVLVYPCLVLLTTCVFWLIFFRR